MLRLAPVEISSIAWVEWSYIPPRGGVQIGFLDADDGCRAKHKSAAGEACASACIGRCCDGEGLRRGIRVLGQAVGAPVLASRCSWLLCSLCHPCYITWGMGFSHEKHLGMGLACDSNSAPVIMNRVRVMSLLQSVVEPETTQCIVDE